MEGNNNYGLYNYNIDHYYSQASQENAQYASQPEAGQTSGVSASASMANERVKVQFLAGLERYAQGVPLNECSTTLEFGCLVTNSGRLTREGHALYRSNLSRDEQQRVDLALHSRRINQFTSSARVEEGFLASLENYVRGVSAMDCSRDIPINRYITDDGHLQPGPGESLYNSLSSDDRERVDQALTVRREVIGNRSAYVQRREVGGNHSPYFPRSR
ncbi:MAG: hypothetical protein P8X74_08735 [Reinekea sp.]